MDVGNKLAGLAVDYCSTVMGARCYLSGMVAVDLQWLDALRHPREPSDHATYSWHSFLSRDLARGSDSALGRT